MSLVSIGLRKGHGKHAVEEGLVKEYLGRASRYGSVDGLWVESEASLWIMVDQVAARTPAKVILFDSTGEMRSSDQFAKLLGGLRDGGSQNVMLVVGGHDGWNERSRKRADIVLSMGRWTLPHALARVVVAEQIYRAMTILAGHPYHCGH